MAHPNKEIAAAIKHAEENGWHIKEGGSHAWGQMYCPHKSKECRCGEFCRQSIWSTPRSAENHARQIRKVVDNCSLNKSNDDKDTSIKVIMPVIRKKP